MSDVSRSIVVRLDEGDSRLVIELTGSDCACEDAQMAVLEFLRQWRRDRNTTPKPKPKPCGCKDAH